MLFTADYYNVDISHLGAYGEQTFTLREKLRSKEQSDLSSMQIWTSACTLV